MKKIWCVQVLVVLCLGLLLVIPPRAISQVLTDEQKADLEKKKEEIKKKVEEELTPEQKEKLKAKKEEAKKKKEEAEKKAEEYKNLTPEQQEAVKQQKKDELRKKVEDKLTPEQKEKIQTVKEEYQNLTPQEKEKIQKQVDKKVDNIEKLTPADKRNLKATVANAKMRYLSLKKSELIKAEDALNAYKNLNAEHQKKLLKYIFEEEESIKKLD